MKIIITESQKDKLFNIFNKLLNDLMDNIKVDSEDWGLGEMDELDEVNSVDHIGVDRVVTFDGIKVYVNLYVNKERDSWDNVWSEIQYRVNQHIPHAKIVLNDVIVEQEMGSLNESQNKILWLRRRLGVPELMDTLKDIVIEGFEYTDPCDYETYSSYETNVANDSAITFINSYIELYGEEHFDSTELEGFVRELVISKYGGLIQREWRDRYCNDDEDESDY
jgi:hypothetical protein